MVRQKDHKEKHVEEKHVCLKIQFCTIFNDFKQQAVPVRHEFVEAVKKIGDDQ